MFLPALALASALAAAAPDAGPSFEVALTSPDGGALDLDGGVPTDSDLALEVAARLTDFRVRLVDATGRQVQSSEDVRVDARTHVTIHPDPPLQTGTHYAVVLEPAVSDAIRDAAGQTHDPVELHFRTSGEPPARRPKPGKRRHRHHR